MVMLTKEGLSNLGSILTKHVYVDTEGSCIFCDSAQQVGNFMELSCSPMNTLEAKHEFSLLIPVSAVKADLSANVETDFGFSKKRSKSW